MATLTNTIPKGVRPGDNGTVWDTQEIAIGYETSSSWGEGSRLVVYEIQTSTRCSGIAINVELTRYNANPKSFDIYGAIIDNSNSMLTVDDSCQKLVRTKNGTLIANISSDIKQNESVNVNNKIIESNSVLTPKTYYICLFSDLAEGYQCVIPYDVTFTEYDGGMASIYVNSQWKKAIPYIYNGSEWKKAIPYIYNGSEWKRGIT
jgi:hypothetical protein